MDLENLRQKIDACDEEIIRLLNERMTVVKQIGEAKNQSGGEVYVPAREKKVFERIAEKNAGPMPDAALRAVYREIMSAALALERGVRVAYLGPPATFTHQAVRAKFGQSVETRDCETIGDVFDAVERRAAEYGVVPIENSTEGAVTHTLDQFMSSTVHIAAEVYLSISLNLLARCGKSSIRRAYSKQEVFGQCRLWLRKALPGVELVPVSSTARAAELAAKEDGAAALASNLAADLYGLDLVEENIQDLAGNTTRFLVIGATCGPPSGEDKTSVVFTVRHAVGALYGALEAFKKHGLNMTRIESRPSKAQPWEYAFFVDFEGHAREERVRTALAALKEHCLTMRVLGSYPAAPKRRDGGGMPQ
jgi:chorismate mutase / prephenate dehydratase